MADSIRAARACQPHPRVGKRRVPDSRRAGKNSFADTKKKKRILIWANLSIFFLFSPLLILVPLPGFISVRSERGLPARHPLQR